VIIFSMLCDIPLRADSLPGIRRNRHGTPRDSTAKQGAAARTQRCCSQPLRPFTSSMTRAPTGGATSSTVAP